MVRESISEKIELEVGWRDLKDGGSCETFWGIVIWPEAMAGGNTRVSLACLRKKKDGPHAWRPL